MKHFYKLFSVPEKINSRLRNLALGLVMLATGNSLVNAQVNIGSGTTTGVIPVVMSTAYTYSQQIFNATEINANGSITGIKLYLASGSTITSSDDWVVYLGTTDKNLFDSTTDWIPVSSLTQVFSGVVVNNNGEVTITFPTPFSYNGNQNLVIAIDENKAGTNTTANRFYTTSTTDTYSNRSLYRSASSDVSPDTPGTGTRSSVHSNITLLGINEACGLPTNVVTGSTTTDSAILNWSPPASGTPTYEYYYSTSNTPPSNTAAALGSVSTNSLTINSTLTAGTYYFFWVRSVCGAQKSAWTYVHSFITECVPVNSMYENFDSYATGASAFFPPCWARLDAQGTVNVSATTPNSGTGNMYQYAANGSSNIVVLPIFSNINANTHWLRFKARVTSAPRDIQVGYITNFADASTFVSLQTLSIANTTYADPLAEYIVEIPASVPASARLAIKNPGNSATTLYYDDVYWEVKPACIKPSGVTVGTVTGNSAQISWMASASSPANGYDIYYSTTNTAPTSSTTPNIVANPGTSATLSPLSPLTPYYVWVRANCGSGSLSEWSSFVATFTTLCQPPAILSATGATVCPGTSATLSATADAGATITWYDAPTGGNTLTTGNSYTTPNLSSTTNYYISAITGSSESVGVANPGALTNAGTTNAGTTFYIEATVVNNPINVQSVDVFPGAAGSASFIRVYLGTASTPVYEIPFTSNVASGGVTPQTIPLNILLNPGVYRFKIEGAGSYYRNYSTPNGVGQSFPYGQGDFTLTGGSNVTTGYYLFYNFIIGNACESARTMVTATVDINCLSTSETNKKDAIKVYPNPFSEVVNITKPELVKSVRVSDLSGKLIKTINQPESVIRLNDLSAGIYLLQLDMKDGSKQTIKVIKK